MSDNVDAISVIKRTWEVLRANFPLFGKLGLIVLASGVVIIIPLAVLNADLISGLILFVIAIAAVIYVNLLVNAAIIRNAVAAARGEAVAETLSQALRDARPYIWDYFFTSFVVGLVVLGGLVLLVVPGILLALRYSVAIPARLDSSDSVTSAMSTSRRLTKGHWGTVFALAAALVLTTVVISALFGEQPVSDDSTGGFSLIGSLLNTVLGVAAVAGSGVLYVMLGRIRSDTESKAA